MRFYTTETITAKDKKGVMVWCPIDLLEHYNDALLNFGRLYFWLHIVDVFSLPLSGGYFHFNIIEFKSSFIPTTNQTFCLRSSYLTYYVLGSI